MAIISAAFSRVVPSPFYGDPVLFRIKALAGTNATLIVAKPASISTIVLANNAAAARSVKFFDLAVAPTVGTSVPAFTLLLEQSISPLVIHLASGGIPFVNGISFSITTGIADTDVAAATLDDVTGFVVFSNYT
jgi:hypothetical protein